MRKQLRKRLDASYVDMHDATTFVISYCFLIFQHSSLTMKLTTLFAYKSYEMLLLGKEVEEVKTLCLGGRR